MKFSPHPFWPGYYGVAVIVMLILAGCSSSGSGVSDASVDPLAASTSATTVMVTTSSEAAPISTVSQPASSTEAAADSTAQDTGIDARCEPWEIFDPTLQAKGIGGTDAHGGLKSSAIGCRRVCYTRFIKVGGFQGWHQQSRPANDSLAHIKDNGYLDKDGSASPASTASANSARIPLTADAISAANPWEANLLFSLTDISTPDDTKRDTDPSGINSAITYAVNGSRNVEIKNQPAAGDDTLDIGSIEIDGTKIEDDDQLANYEIKVAPSQNYCHLWNTTTDQETFRSQN